MSTEQFLTHENELIRDCAKLALKSSKYHFSDNFSWSTKFVFKVDGMGMIELHDYSKHNGWHCSFHEQDSYLPIWKFRYRFFVKTINDLLEPLKERSPSEF